MDHEIASASITSESYSDDSYVSQKGDPEMDTSLQERIRRFYKKKNACKKSTDRKLAIPKRSTSSSKNVPRESDKRNKMIKSRSVSKNDRKDHKKPRKIYIRAQSEEHVRGDTTVSQGCHLIIVFTSGKSHFVLPENLCRKLSQKVCFVDIFRLIF